MIHALTEGKTLLSGLRWLSLSNRGGKDGSPVGSEAIRRLAASPAAAQLVRLDLSNNQVDDIRRPRPWRPRHSWVLSQRRAWGTSHRRRGARPPWPRPTR